MEVKKTADAQIDLGGQTIMHLMTDAVGFKSFVI